MPDDNSKLYPLEQIDKRIAYIYFLTTKANSIDFENIINSTYKQATFNDIDHIKNFMSQQFQNLINLDTDMKNCFTEISNLLPITVVNNNSNKYINKKKH
jgi:hypothetical protein